MKPKVGDRVTYQKIIFKKDTHRGHTWKSIDCPGEGVFVGYRYKQTGFMDRETGEYGYGGTEYWAERGPRTKVALVAKDPWIEPTTVDPEGLEVISGPCYTLPDGDCISPFNCIHGEGLPLEDFVAYFTDEVRLRMPMSG